MVNPFAAALDAIFASSMAEDALFTSADGEELTLRVVRSRPDLTSGFGGGQIITATNIIEIRRADVERPAEGGTVAIVENDPERGYERAVSYVLRGEPQLDVEGLTWTCGAEPFDE